MKGEGWQARIESLDDFILEEMEDWKVPGAAIVIVKNGEVILSKGYGTRNLKENKKVTEETIFAIGSSSKAFTAMVAGILVDEDRLKWDVPVTNYMPWFKMHDIFATERVTVRDMLCHRTGLARNHAAWYLVQCDRKELVRRIRYLLPNRDFRTGIGYQNQLYAAIGYLVEEITGKTWEEFVQEKIFDPLGMVSSQFSVEQSKVVPDLAAPYAEMERGVVEVPFHNLDTIGPAGSINSNIKDMARWLLLNLNQGKYGGIQVISKASFEEMVTPQIIEGPERIGFPCKFPELQFHTYGLGWFIESFRGHKMVHHGGGIDGFSALVSFMPDEKVGMVILTNLKNRQPFVHSLQYEAYDRLLGYKGRDWSGEVKEHITIVEQNLIEEKEALLQSAKQGTSPSLALQEYSGIYEHVGYGVITVSVEGENLKVKHGKNEIILKHHHYNVFFWDEGLFGVYFLVTFHINKDGDINKLMIPYNNDQTEEEVEFIRRS